MTISTENFGSILSVADFSAIFEIDDPTTAMVEYFVNRGYTVDVNLRAAPYDWRLGAGIIILKLQLSMFVCVYVPGADTEKLKGGGTGYCNQGSVRKHTMQG